ncbi:MAG: hypothetical protein JOZ51_29095 [Chloroflexi bacterium]|nr:hypothetical protein [Chloroflexota bacterium]
MFHRLVVLLLLAIATVSASAPVGAAPSSARVDPQALVVVETKFYSDATYTVQVGYKLLDQCSGDVYVEGTQTVYKIQKRTACDPY